jgi:type IV pilus assembly protein PilM
MAKGSNHVLGLDIGNDTIKIVELAVSRGGVNLVSVPTVIPTPPGALSGGIVVDTTAVSDLLKSCAAETRLGTRKAITAVGGDTSVVARVIQMPRMSGKELNEAMQFELDRQTPFPVDQVIYDFAPLPATEQSETSQNMDVFLAVAQEDMINAHVDTLQSARLAPQHIDVEPLALARSLIAGNETYMAQTVMIVDLGATFTGIYMFRRGWPSFLRTIPTAGEALTDSVREQLNLSVEQAEAAKRLFADLSGLVYETPPAPTVEEQPSVAFESAQEATEGSAEFPSGYDSATEEQAVTPAPAGPAAAPRLPAEEITAEVRQAQALVGQALSSRLYDLINEINRSLEFYRRQNRNETIGAIILSGGSAQLPGLPRMIAGETGVPTVLADPFQYLYTEGVAPEAYLRDLGPSLAIAVGLALRDMLD